MIVRPIEPDDADGFIAVFEAVAAEGRWIGTELPVDDDRRARWRRSAGAPTDDVFTNVAVDDERVVGFAHAQIDRGRAHLGMAVLAEYCERGLDRRRSTAASSGPAAWWRVAVIVIGGATAASCGTRSR